MNISIRPGATIWYRQWLWEIEILINSNRVRLRKLGDGQRQVLSIREFVEMMGIDDIKWVSSSPLPCSHSHVNEVRNFVDLVDQISGRNCQS